jgi:hypothetical protein
MPTSAKATGRRRAGLGLAVLAGLGGCVGSLGDGPANPSGPPAPSCGVQRPATRVPDDAGAGSCILALGRPPNSNVSNDCIHLFIDGVPIPQATTHDDGWDYVDANHMTIQLYGAACAAVEADPPPTVVVSYPCCGIA